MAQRYVALLTDMFKSSFITKMSAVAHMGRLKELKKLMDYSEYGAAPLLGIKGAVLKMHGSSKSNAVRNAIIKGRTYVEENVVDIISRNVDQYEKNASDESKIGADTYKKEE